MSVAHFAGTVDSLLSRKGSQTWAVDPDSTVFEAIRMMAEKNIGALLVMRGAQLVGVISERDYTRNVVLKGKSSRETPVREVISPRVVSATRETTIEQCMHLMTENRIRHLPCSITTRWWASSPSATWLIGSFRPSPMP